MGSGNSRAEPYKIDWEKLENDANGEYVKPTFKNGCYGNPFDTWDDRGFRDLLEWRRTSDDLSAIPWGKKKELDSTLPIVKPDLEKLANPPANQIQMMWIGHASMLVQMDGLTVLTDPVFSHRCGPMGRMGPPRYRPPPCAIEDLPTLDAVVISHNHYDHLDQPAVVRLNRKFGPDLRWFVASGTAKWMRDQGCSNVTELGWWDEAVVEKDGKKFTFAATPAQHWCLRSGFDRCKALWCSWVVKGPTKSFYFAGDTGYCFAFKQIGRKYGPISLAAIPIGAYEPRWFMRPQHVNPEEAVYIHKDVRAQRSVGVHWGTFRLTDEHYMEPKQKLVECVQQQGLTAGEFYTVRHGDVVIVDTEQTVGTDNMQRSPDSAQHSTL